MKLKLEIDCENEAFADPFELPRILNNVAQVIAFNPAVPQEGGCIDCNGNTVGRWSISDE